VPFTKVPFSTDNGDSGRNYLQNGAVPADIAVAAPFVKNRRSS